MRSDFELQPFRSAHVYGIVDLLSINVRGGGDWDDATFPDLFETPDKLFKPSKDTLLHEVIRNLDDFYRRWWIRKVPDETAVEYVTTLDEFEIPVPDWLRAGEAIMERRDDVADLMALALERQLPSIFHLLFSDRDFLTAFAGRVADYVATLDPAAHPELLADGRVRRPSHIPTWLKAGVFYRDRGRCQHCWKDLSGLSRAVSDLQLDHIIPLGDGGSNDPTNFQLSCAPCNQKKGKQRLNTVPRFAPYW